MPLAFGLLTLGAWIMYSGLKGLSLIDVLAGKEGETLDPSAKIDPNLFTQAEVASVPSSGGDFGAGAGPVGSLSGTPKDIIDKLVVPLAKSHHMNTGISPAMVTAANAVHGATSRGTRSDHQGPPSVAWADDMSNTPKGNFDRSAPTKEMDALARDLAAMFHMPWHGSGLTEGHVSGYRIQMLYRTDESGGHWNHVHLGIRK